MFSKSDIVLIDTNVILEAHRVNCWKGVSDYFSLHTVEKVIEETQTGFQNRSPEQTIDAAGLRATFSHIQAVEQIDIVTFDMGNQITALDDGEKALIIYAGTLKQKVWFLNSPDKAAIKYACSRGWGDSLISLEAMAKHLHLKFKYPLKQNYTEQGLAHEKLRVNQGLL